MILSDKTIKKLVNKEKLRIGGTTQIIPGRFGRIKTKLSNEENIQPASVDVTLGSSFKTVKRSTKPNTFDTETKYVDVPKNADGTYTIGPKQFVLATTSEYIKLPDNVAAFVDGRSSIGRMGLFVENAGFIDPGFQGEITLELFNGSDTPINVKPGHRIGQIVLVKMTTKAEHPYKGKYQGQMGATGSRKHLDKENKR